MNNPIEIDALLAEGAVKARGLATKKMQNIRRAIGVSK
jgi:Arc/MetJ family transcription regulator